MISDRPKQELLLSYLIADPQALAVCRHVMLPDYFDKEIQPAVKFILDHSEKYRSSPNHAMVAVETGIGLPDVSDSEKPDRVKWVCDEIESHCRLSATIAAVYSAAEKISRGETSDIIDPIKAAVMLSLHRDLGLNYFEDPGARLRRMLLNGAHPTGFKHLDAALYGGVYRGGLQIAMAPSGVGKSMYLANQAVNYLLMGKSVVYITLELPADWVAKRIDSMLTGIPSQKIFDRIDEVATLVVRKSKTFGGPCGDYYIKRMPSGTKPTEVSAYLKSLEMSIGVVPDALIVDYIDIMGCDQKVGADNISLKDRFVAEALREIAISDDMFCWTASQMVRGSIDSEDQSQSQISGGKTKIDTCDNAFGIYQSLEMKEQGLIQLQLVKTRTSAGQGRKIVLTFDGDTARYGDAPDELNERVQRKQLDKKAPPGSPARPGATSGGGKVQSAQPQAKGTTVSDNLERLRQFKRSVESPPKKKDGSGGPEGESPAGS